MNNRTVESWTERPLGRGMLPIPWARWPEVGQIRPDDTDRVVPLGWVEEYSLDEGAVQGLLITIVQLQAVEPPFPRPVSEDGKWATRALPVLERYGPILPGDAHGFDAVDDSGRPNFPVTPPEQQSLLEMGNEMRQMFVAMSVLNELEKGQPGTARKLLEGVGPAAVRGFPIETLEHFANTHSREYGTPGGDLGTCHKWLSHMATRWPMLVQPDPRYRNRLVPIPASPCQVFWLTMAYQTGAIELPYPRSENQAFSFCAECGRPVFSSIPRHRGSRVFCDPDEGQDRSVCANRFHSREGKARSKARRMAAEGSDVETIAKSLGRSTDQVREWIETTRKAKQ